MESNKLIAEFLGAKPILSGASVEYEMYGIIECIKDEPNEKHFFIPDEMEFKEDWRWLIEAVKSCYDNGADSNQIGDITHAFLDFNREDTYNAVVEFIKLYNKTKTSISFDHENKIYTIDYTNELTNGNDWWHTYKVKGVMFDLHYCEDYNEIVVYLSNTDYKAIARKEIN